MKKDLKKEKKYHLLYIMMEVLDLMTVGEIATCIRFFVYIYFILINLSIFK